MLSSEKGLPFDSEYLSRKLEAEKFIIEECKNIKPCMIRPGFVVDAKMRNWSPPLGVAVDLLYYGNEYVAKQIPVVGPASDWLFPAKSTKLATVYHFAQLGVFG